MKSKLLNIANKKYFYEIYCGIVCLISLISWAKLPVLGLSILFILISLMLFITNEIKFILPGLINFVFTIGDGFQSNKVPIGLIVVGMLLVATIIFYLIKNKIKFSFGKFGICFLAFAILGVIPIFWSILKNYPSEGFMYLLYFNWFLYLIIYVFITSVVKGNIKKELAICLSYLGLLISFECLIQAIRVWDNFNGLFSLYYSLGWGICNEAGIMLLVSMPFVFYLIHTEKLNMKIVNIVKIAIMVFGIVITTSRGSYLFGLVETALLILFTVYQSKYKKVIIPTLIFSGVVALIVLLSLGIVQDMINNVFDHGLESNGRSSLYLSAIEHFTKNPLTVLFGDGIVNAFEIVTDANNFGAEPGTLRMIVYHSTIFQTLAAMGFIGMIIMCFHFYQKYSMIFKSKSLYMAYLFIGFLCVDLYGMIDNTYHMYYYMIILAIILAISEKDNIEDK